MKSGGYGVIDKTSLKNVFDTPFAGSYPILKIGCRCDFHLQPIYIYYPMAKTNLFTPNFFRNFLDECKLCPLFRFGELIAYLAGRKAALGAQAKSIEGDIR